MTIDPFARAHAGGGARGFALHLAAFAAGFITMALEMLIGRTFIPYFGGTIFTWGALISVFLTGMTAGYVIGGRCADRRPQAGPVAALFLISAVLVVAVPAFGERLIHGILDHIEDVRYAALLAALALACLPAATLAAVAPYCVRLLLDRKENSGTIAGRLSGLATAGSILGTLGTIFLFIPSFGVKLIYGVLAVASALMGIVFLIIGGANSKMPVRTGASDALLVVLFAVLILQSTPGAAQSSPLLARNDGLLEKVDSEYNTIIVEKQQTLVSLYFGYRNNRYRESAIDLANPADLVLPYTRFMTAVLAYHPGAVERVALVGLGGGSTISYLVASLPSAIADVAELDPAVIGLARRYFGVAANERLRIHNKDGRVFLHQSKDKYDLILLDAYRGSYVPFHLTTQEFYRLVKARLREGGVVAQNVAHKTLFFDSAYATMKSTFDSVDAFEADGNIVLVGYTGPRLSAAELGRNAASVQENLRLRYDLREMLKARRDVEVQAGAKILTDDFAPVEMLNALSRHNEKRQ